MISLREAVAIVRNGRKLFGQHPIRTLEEALVDIIKMRHANRDWNWITGQQAQEVIEQALVKRGRA